METEREKSRKNLIACLKRITFLQNEMDRLMDKIRDPQVTIEKLQVDVDNRSHIYLTTKRFLFVNKNLHWIYQVDSSFLELESVAFDNFARYEKRDQLL